MVEYNDKQVQLIWDNGSDLRAAALTRINYYNGIHDIVGRGETYADGNTKSEVVANWMAYGVDTYVGSLTGTPYQITIDDPSLPSETAGYDVVSALNNLQLQDVEILKRCLITGYAVETHEFIEGSVVIKNYDPLEWAFSYDENGKLALAIRRITLPVGSVYQDVILEKEKLLQTIYTADSIIDMELVGKAYQVIEEVQHGYGVVPIVLWRTSPAHDALITDDLIGLQDEYNDIDNVSGDDIRNNTNAKLIITGCDATWLKTNAALINALNMLPLPEGASASYMLKGNDVERVESRLRRAREHLHLRMCVPDIQSIVGATGATSGIALKLKYLPMIQRASSMIHYIRASVVERIDLINVIIGKLGEPVIENYKIVVQFSIPTNRIEEWQAIAGLKDIVSHRTMLELLTDIEDPERELNTLQEEADNPVKSLDDQLMKSLTQDDALARETGAII